MRAWRAPPPPPPPTRPPSCAPGTALRPPLTVTLADGTTFQLGGDRAARAQAVIIGKTRGDRPTIGHWGVRANLAKAQTEATGLAQGRTRLVRSQVRGQRSRQVDVAPVAEWAVAVPVTDAEAS